jgi:hypothetical protein
MKQACWGWIILFDTAASAATPLGGEYVLTTVASYQDRRLKFFPDFNGSNSVVSLSSIAARLWVAASGTDNTLRPIRCAQVLSCSAEASRPGPPRSSALPIRAPCARACSQIRCAWSRNVVQHRTGNFALAGCGSCRGVKGNLHLQRDLLTCILLSCISL